MRRFVRTVVLVAALLATAAFFQAPTPTPTPGQEESPLYVILVMDYSPSIDLPIGKDLPPELADAASKLRALADNQDYIKAVETINIQFKSRPDVIKAKQDSINAVNALDQWMRDHGYEMPYLSEGSKFNSYLTEIGCTQANGTMINATTPNPIYMSYFMEYLPPPAVSMDQVVAAVEQGCRLDNVTLTPEQKSQVEALLAFLTDPEYVQLAQARYQANLVVISLNSQLLANPDYAAATNQIDTLVGGGPNAFLSLTGEVASQSHEAGIPTGLTLVMKASQIMRQISTLDERATGRKTSDDFVLYHYEALEVIRDYGTKSPLTWVSELFYRGGNNMGEALQKAIDNMPAEYRDHPSLLVLLDAGTPNVGMTSDEILSTIPAKARERNMTICSVGFGSQESDVPASLLKGLAEQTGGRYLFVSGEDAGSMMGFVVSCRQSLIADVLQQFTGTITQDETVEAGRITVGTSKQMNVTLTYLDGRVSMDLVDPSGKSVDVAYQGAINLTEENTQVVTISDPQPGAWLVRLTGDEVPATGTAYSVVASADKSSGGTPWLVWVGLAVVLVAIGVAAYIFRDKLTALIRKPAA